MRATLDVWGDGAALAYGYGRGTASAPPRIAADSANYSRALHECVLGAYARDAPPQAQPHPLAQLAAAAGRAAGEAGAAAAAADGDAEAPRPPRPLPKVLLLERHGSRHVPNFEALREALSALPIDLHIFGAAQGGNQSEHLAAFADADVIVGPHGAGLTNAITSWPGT